jgi:hypothetical protein
VRRLLALLCGLLPAAALGLAAVTPAVASTGLPPIRHVFVIVLENESASTTFGAHSPAPYLARTLTSQGAFLPRYYGTGHESNDNYISMISGQAPNAENQADCPVFSDFPAAATGADGQQEGVGCVYPAAIQNIATQLAGARLTWRDYNQSMGADPAREAGVCAHPGIGKQDNTQSETASDAYATRHNPFVYFHAIIDDTTLCDTHVVNLSLLPHDLGAAANTPNYVFITPDLCGDGHDAVCKDPRRSGGFAGIEQFLQQWVPMITRSPAFRQQNGLLIIAFDEASTSDAGSCCGEIPGPGSPRPGIQGSGGGLTGAVLLSPCIAPGTVSQTAYNHYSQLRTIEDVFGVGHLGYAQLPGVASFGPDVFTASARCSAPPRATLRVRRVRGRRIVVRWSSNVAGSVFEVGVRRLRPRPTSHWRTLLRGTRRRSLTYVGRRGTTYQFRVRATSGVGIMGRWAGGSARAR